MAGQTTGQTAGQTGQTAGQTESIWPLTRASPFRSESKPHAN